MSSTRGADGRHPYQRIADKLRQDIEAGVYPPGTKLPSTSDLEVRFNVSRMTARSAIQTLRGEGLVVARHGVGVFVARLDEPPEPFVVDPDESPVMTRLDALNDQLQGGFGVVLERLDAIEQRLGP